MDKDMHFDAYRIHSADEALEALLDPSRRDGWVASDEEYETQPHGISCCDSLQDLADYVRTYSLAAQPGDLLVGLIGRRSHDEDRDQYASRLIVESYEVIGSAAAWVRAIKVDIDAVDTDMIDECLVWADYVGTDELADEARRWVERRMDHARECGDL